MVLKRHKKQSNDLWRQLTPTLKFPFLPNLVISEVREDSCLRSATIPILGDEDCKRMYSDSYNKITTGI